MASADGLDAGGAKEEASAPPTHPVQDGTVAAAEAHEAGRPPVERDGGGGWNGGAWHFRGQ